MPEYMRLSLSSLAMGVPVKPIKALGKRHACWHNKLIGTKSALRIGFKAILTTVRLIEILRVVAAV